MTLVALAISAIDVVDLVNAGTQPLTRPKQAQFVTGCDTTSRGLVDCQCLLSRFEADGYTTLNELRSLLQQAQSEEFTNQTGGARTEVVRAASACRTSVSYSPQAAPGGG